MTFTNKLLSSIAIIAVMAPAASNAQIKMKRIMRPMDQPAVPATQVAQMPAGDILKQPDTTVIQTNKGDMTITEIKSKILASMVPDPANKVGVFKPKGRTASVREIGTATNVLAEGALIGAGMNPVFSCDGKPASLWKVQGQVTPGATVRVLGRCIGEQRGEVRLYGSFSSGFRVLPITSWGNATVVQIPSISGVGDEVMRVEMVTGNRQTTNSVEVNFEAARQSVDVSEMWVGNCPSSYIQHTENWAKAECKGNTASYYTTWETSSVIVHDDGPNGVPIVTWAISINPKCNLENQWAVPISGTSVTKFENFDQGPPHHTVGYVRTNWDQHKEWGLFSDTQIVTAGHAMHATASCPIGISPRP